MKGNTSIEGTLLMLDDTTPHVAVPVQAIVAQASLPVGAAVQVAATTLSDGSGKYQLINLKPGEYQLRCQVLGGYVYYGEKKTRESEDGVTLDEFVSLRIEQGETLSNIDFRFAAFKKGTWKNYSYLDGLAANYVRDIHCDPGGMIWFATTGGICRYDGKDFANCTKKYGLVAGHGIAIHCDPDGVMWFGAWSGGVSRYDGEVVVNFAEEDGLADNTVWAIYTDSDGMMWFGTRGGVSCYNGKEFVNLTTEDGLASNGVGSIQGDPDGVMWFATGGWRGGTGLSRYDGKEFVNLTTEDGLVDNRVSAIHCGPDGMMWFGTLGGVSCYNGKEFVNLTTEDGLASNLVNAIYGDPDGVMWFGTEGGGVSRYDGKTFVNYTTEDGLVDNRVDTIYRDPDGDMWFGTEGFGVSRYDGRTFVNFTTKDGLLDNRVNAIHRDPDGIMWFGTGYWKGGPDGAGISRYDGKEFVNFTKEDGLADSSVLAIHRDQDGVIWFGTGGSGVFRYDGNESVNFTTEDGLADNRVRAIRHDTDGVLWFGTGFWTGGSGVSRYDGKKFVNFTTEDGLANNAVPVIHADPDGVMWFGTSGGVSRYDARGMGDCPHFLATRQPKHKFVSFTTEDGLAHNDVWDIYRDAENVLWFGTSGGVSRYDGKEFVSFTEEDGLASNGVAAIHRGIDGTMWFGSNFGGICGYDGIAWTSLDTRDGLADNVVTGIIQDSDGFLWFITEEGGITRYRPGTTAPRIYIVSVTTDQTYRDLSAIPAFTPDTRVIIEYNAIDFRTLLEKRQYRIRIRGMDSDWRRPTKSNTFDFILGEPGTYTFEAQAIDRDLNYSEPASVKLEVIPDPRNHQIAQLKGELAEHERAELERVHQELEDARQIQQSLLPDKPPKIEDFEIAGTSIPAREVSGDFYSYLSLGENIGIVLADVTGKSVKAAMVAAMTSGMLHSEVESNEDIWDSPAGMFGRLNVRLHPHLIRGMFTAMSLGIIQPLEKRLIFSNAGMPYPIVKRGSEVWELEVNGMPLGLMDSAEYEDLSIEPEVGDFVVFCSDGVIEAMNEADEMYQTERLLKVVRQADADTSAQDMVDLIVQDVNEFAGSLELSDDITIVVIRCKE